MVALLRMPTRIGPDTRAERRMFPRKEVHTRVEGKRLDHTIRARREPQVSLALRDLSVGGMSALSQTPLDCGERVSVFFPPQGASRGWDAYGRVIRCEPSGLGYRIAVEFDPLPAA
jgi:PilZ domain